MGNLPITPQCVLQEKGDWMVMKLEFRLLTKEEIDVRVQSATSSGAVLLPYKDARCDMNILDETVGSTGWQRNHEVVKGNLFCTVSIYDSELQQWVSKQDVGIESNTEAEKGEASDSFKRACFNWGIGRELYTAPFIYVNLKPDEIDNTNGKVKVKNKIKFTVSHVTYENKRIVELKIIDQNGQVRFDMKSKLQNDTKQTKETKPKKTSTNGKSVKTKYVIINELIKGTSVTLDQVTRSIQKSYNTTNINDLNDEHFEEYYIKLQSFINEQSRV